MQGNYSNLSVIAIDLSNFFRFNAVMLPQIICLKNDIAMITKRKVKLCHQRIVEKCIYNKRTNGRILKANLS